MFKSVYFKYENHVFYRTHMDTYEGESRRLAALHQNTTLSVPSDGFTVFGQRTDQTNGEQLAQTASNPEQSLSACLQLVTATTNRQSTPK